MQGLHHLTRAFVLALTFGKTWLVNGTPANATSVTIAVYDDTAGLQAVPAGTAMQNTAPGQYSYTVPAAVREHAYTATIIVIFGGQTYTSQETAPAMTRRQERREECEGLGAVQDLGNAIAENAMGAESIQSAAGSMKAHPLESQIAADQYLASKRAAQRGRPGIRIMPLTGGPSG